MRRLTIFAASAVIAALLGASSAPIHASGISNVPKSTTKTTYFSADPRLLHSAQPGASRSEFRLQPTDDLNLTKQAANHARLAYAERVAAVRAHARAVKRAHARAVARAKALAAQKARVVRHAVRYSSNASKATMQAFARSLVGGQIGCLIQLWDRESGWNPRASNPSGAYGIPQALPGSKMGPGWQTDWHVQIRWGAGYVNRWGGACGSWAHFLADGWY